MAIIVGVDPIYHNPAAGIYQEGENFLFIIEAELELKPAPTETFILVGPMNYDYTLAGSITFTKPLTIQADPNNAMRPTSGALPRINYSTLTLFNSQIIQAGLTWTLRGPFSFSSGPRTVVSSRIESEQVAGQYFEIDAEDVDFEVNYHNTWPDPDGDRSFI